MIDLIDYEKYAAVKLERDQLRNELARLREQLKNLKQQILKASGEKR